MDVREAPFSFEPEPKRRLLECDYTQRWSLEELRSGTQPTRPIRIYTEGVFDLFHYGHANMFRQLKTMVLPEKCPVYVLAGAQSDVNCIKYKRKPIQRLNNRQAMLQQCRFVDEVIPDIEWAPTPEFLTKYKIDFVSHDNQPYLLGSGGDGDVYGWLKKAGLFIATSRTENVSTTKLRKDIISIHEEEDTCMTEIKRR